jgi:hypothetical protein
MPLKYRSGAAFGPTYGAAIDTLYPQACQPLVQTAVECEAGPLVKRSNQ